MRSCTLVAVLAAAAAECSNADARSAPVSQALARDAVLRPPAKGSIAVAFVITDAATVIDFAGPWEVFQDVMVASRGSSMDEQMPFHLFTVSDSREPIRASGGLRIVPDYTFDDAPQPWIVVVGAQAGKSPKMLYFGREVAEKTARYMEYDGTGWKRADG